MAITYTQAKATLDTIAQESEHARLALNNIEGDLDMVIQKLNILENTHTTFVSDVDSIALANPDDTVWQSAKAEKDKLVADFVEIRTAATNMKNAINAL